MTFEFDEFPLLVGIWTGDKRPWFFTEAMRAEIALMCKLVSAMSDDVDDRNDRYRIALALKDNDIRERNATIESLNERIKQLETDGEILRKMVAAREEVASSALQSNAAMTTRINSVAESLENTIKNLRGEQS